MTTTAAEIGLASALVQLSHLVQHVYAEASRSHDLTPQQAQLLCLLLDGPVGMTELSRALHLEKSSLTGLVDRVERRGLVDRVRDSRDRRACQITLTPAGRQLAYDCHHAVTARLDTLTAGLPARDKFHLATTLGSFLPDTPLRRPPS